MGVMHIPGHTHQAPREVALEEIEAVLGDCHLCQLYQSRSGRSDERPDERRDASRPWAWCCPG